MSIGLLTDFWDKRPKQWNMDMRLGTWNVRSYFTLCKV
jgi:hypothetical protein